MIWFWNDKGECIDCNNSFKEFSLFFFFFSYHLQTFWSTLSFNLLLCSPDSLKTWNWPEKINQTNLIFCFALQTNHAFYNFLFFFFFENEKEILFFRTNKFLQILHFPSLCNTKQFCKIVQVQVYKNTNVKNKHWVCVSWLYANISWTSAHTTKERLQSFWINILKCT